MSGSLCCYDSVDRVNYLSDHSNPSMQPTTNPESLIKVNRQDLSTLGRCDVGPPSPDTGRYSGTEGSFMSAGIVWSQSKCSSIGISSILERCRNYQIFTLKKGQLIARTLRDSHPSPTLFYLPATKRVKHTRLGHTKGHDAE